MLQASSNEEIWYRVKRMYESLLKIYRPYLGMTIRRHKKDIKVTNAIINIFEDRLMNAISNIYGYKGERK